MLNFDTRERPFHNKSVSDVGTQSSLAWGHQNERKILNGEQPGIKAGRPRGQAPEPKVSHLTKQVALAPKGETQCGS